MDKINKNKYKPGHIHLTSPQCNGFLSDRIKDFGNAYLNKEYTNNKKECIYSNQKDPIQIWIADDDLLNDLPKIIKKTKKVFGSTADIVIIKKGSDFIKKINKDQHPDILFLDEHFKNCTFSSRTDLKINLPNTFIVFKSKLKKPLQTILQEERNKLFYKNFIQQWKEGNIYSGESNVNIDNIGIRYTNMIEFFARTIKGSPELDNFNPQLFKKIRNKLSHIKNPITFTKEEENKEGLIAILCHDDIYNDDILIINPLMSLKEYEELSDEKYDYLKPKEIGNLTSSLKTRPEPKLFIKIKLEDLEINFSKLEELLGKDKFGFRENTFNDDMEFLNTQCKINGYKKGSKVLCFNHATLILKSDFSKKDLKKILNKAITKEDFPKLYSYIDKMEERKKKIPKKQSLSNFSFD